MMGDLLVTAFLQLLLSIVVLLGGVISFIAAKLDLHLHTPRYGYCNHSRSRSAKEREFNCDGVCGWHCERCNLQEKPSSESRHRRSVKRKGCRGFDEEGEPRNEIESLRKALRIEQEARNALYIELEKERNAAASAADEAMAMILRLQKEKASVQIESQQFRRMVEQKQIHDQQAINLLRDIIVTQERDKLALQNQLDSYRLGLRHREGNDFTSSHVDVDVDVDIRHGPGDSSPMPPDDETSHPAACENGADSSVYDSDIRLRSPPAHTKTIIIEEDRRSMKEDTMREQELEEMPRGKPTEQQQRVTFSPSSSQVDSLFLKKRPSGSWAVH